MRNTIDKIIRVAIYLRVSTEEQALHGYSLESQETELLAYAKEKGYKIVGIYRDEGFSARKPVLKRKMVQELLADVEAGKIDLILFTKLDRWFRSVREYHNVQAVLDKNKVVWKAILEDYQTETADGRLKVNIMLSVAENEADRTSERIKFVFDSRIQKGEYCYGGWSTPFGYQPERIDGLRKLVKDPELEDAVQAFWDKMQKYKNIRTSAKEVNIEYGLHRTHKSWMRMARNEIYTGEFKGVKNFCPPYIDRKAWEDLQHPERKIKSTQGNRVYLFTGLIRCPLCGCTLKSTYKTYPNDRSREYYSYRCAASSLGFCEYRRCLSERKVEKYMLENIKTLLNNYENLKADVNEQQKKKRKKKVDTVKLTEQLRRLNNVYLAGNISDDEYSAQSAELRNAIAETEKETAEKPETTDFSAIKELFSNGFEEVYKSFTKQEKQRFWHSIVKEIHLDDNKISSIIPVEA